MPSDAGGCLRRLLSNLRQGDPPNAVEVGKSVRNGFFLLNLSKTKIVFRRQERHKRKKSDVFKGTLSEGMNKRESSDEDLKDVEIPMDSDDEEAQIRKRREARQKMLQRLQTDENSPASSPATPGSPMLDRFKEKNRISQGFYSFDLIC